jgi:transcriptional regulator with XRE-family HTH domain
VETFGQALRDLRSRRGLSLRGLASLVHYSSGYLWQVEHGQKPPNGELAQRLDVALGADGVLVRLAAGPVRGRVPGDRVGRQVMGLLRPDAAAVDQVAQVLASYRQLEDSAGARAVLAPMLEHAALVSALRRPAGGQLHDRLLSLESQVAQFAGWLHQDQGDRAEAERWYGLALGIAHEVDDPGMVASVLSMRSNTAWGAGDLGQAVRLGEAACRPAATPGVLALSHQQVARAYGAVGRRSDALAALDRAETLMAQAQRSPDAEPPWIYFADPVRLAIQRAMVLRELGDHAAAVEGFEQAIGALPVGYARDRGTYLARLAVTLELAGERDGAVEVAGQARVLAEATGSTRTLAELSRIAI